MAGSQVDKTVLFTLRIQTDDEAMSALQTFGKRVAAVQKKFDQGAVTSAKIRTAQSIETFKEGEAQKTRALERALEERQGLRQRFSDTGSSVGAGQKAPRAIDSRTKARERETTATEKQHQADERAASHRQVAQEREQRATDKTARDAEKGQERAIKAVQAAKIKEQRAIDSTQRKYESATEQVTSYKMQAKSAFVDVGMGAIQAGRGFAMLGLVSKKSSEEMVRGLIKIQGAYDILKGSFEVWKKLSEGMKAYRQATAAATTAENAFALARLKNSKIPPPLPALAARGAVLGLGGMIAGGAVAVGGIAAAGALMTPWGQRKASEKLQEMGTDESGGTKGWFRGLSYATGSLQATSPLSRAKNALYGQETVSPMELRREFAAEDKSKKAADKAEKNRELGKDMKARHVEYEENRGEENRTIRAVAKRRSDQSVADMARRRRVAAVAGDRAIASRTRRAQEADRKRFEADVAGGGMSAFDKQRRGMQLTERERRAEADVRDRQAIRPLQEQRAIAKGGQRFATQSVLSLASQREQTEARLETAQGSRGHVGVPRIGAELKAIKQASAEANEQLATATRSRLDAERAIATIRIRAADESIRRTQDEIAMRKSAIERERDQYRTAEERFGLLSEGEQNQVLSLKKRFDQGQDVGVGGMKQLAQYGTIDEQEALGKYARDRTARTGFKAEFGKEEPGRIMQEQARIKQMQKEMAGMEVKVDVGRDYRVKLETNIDATVERLSAVINAAVTRQENLINKKVAAGVAQLQITMQRQSNELNTQRLGGYR